MNSLAIVHAEQQFQALSASGRNHLRQLHRPILGLVGSALLCALLLTTVRSSPRELGYLLLAYGEVLLPIIVGSLTAGIVMNDRSRELWLTMSYPFWRIVLGRAVVLLTTALLLWTLLAGLGSALARSSLQLATLRIILGGMTGCIWFGALGCWASWRLSSSVGGGVICATLWAGPLLFREALLATPFGALIHPFLTLQAADHPLWLVNRALLLSLAVVLFSLTLRALRHEEWLLPHTSTLEEL